MTIPTNPTNPNDHRPRTTWAIRCQVAGCQTPSFLATLDAKGPVSEIPDEAYQKAEEQGWQVWESSPITHEPLKQKRVFCPHHSFLTRKKGESQRTHDYLVRLIGESREMSWVPRTAIDALIRRLLSDPHLRIERVMAPEPPKTAAAPSGVRVTLNGKSYPGEVRDNVLYVRTDNSPEGEVLAELRECSTTAVEGTGGDRTVMIEDPEGRKIELAAVEPEKPDFSTWPPGTEDEPDSVRTRRSMERVTKQIEEMKAMITELISEVKVPEQKMPDYGRGGPFFLDQVINDDRRDRAADDQQEDLR